MNSKSLKILSQILSSDKKIIGEFLKVPFFSDIVKDQGVVATF